MAKKYRQSNIKNLEPTVLYLYNRGILHSTIIHTVLLLILASLFPIEIDKPVIKIRLNFVSSDDLVEPDRQPLPDPIEVFPIKDVDTKELEASSIKEGLDSVSLLADNSDISNIPAPETEEIVDKDLLDDIQIENLNMEVVDRSSKTNADKDIKPKRSLLPGVGTLVQTYTQRVSDYNAGEIQNRLKEYGAKTGDIQISLSWDTVDDLDLYVTVNPIGSRINWTNRMGICGGMLDIDMNASPRLLTRRPIENIFWGVGRAPIGEYVIGVHVFMNWSGAQQIRATLVIKKDNETKTLPIIVRYGQQPTPITRFTRQ